MFKKYIMSKISTSDQDGLTRTRITLLPKTTDKIYNIIFAKHWTHTSK